MALALPCFIEYIYTCYKMREFLDLSRKRVEVSERAGHPLIHLNSNVPGTLRQSRRLMYFS